MSAAHLRIFSEGAAGLNAMMGAGVASQAEEIDKSRLKLCQILADTTGRPLSEIEAMMDHDHYWCGSTIERRPEAAERACVSPLACSLNRGSNAAEAKELGLVDKIGQKGHFFPQSAPAGKAP